MVFVNLTTLLIILTINASPTKAVVGQQYACLTCYEACDPNWHQTAHISHRDRLSERCISSFLKGFSWLQLLLVLLFRPMCSSGSIEKYTHLFSAQLWAL